LVIDDLEPDTEYDIVASSSSLARTRVATARTLRPPPGQQLARFATISDLHIGEEYVGILRLLNDERHRGVDLDPYPVRCAAAAVSEIEGWGAEVLIAKGDLTCDSTPVESTKVAEILSASKLPVHAVLGNHDVKGSAAVAGALRSVGAKVSVEASALDIPGARLVFGHTPRTGLHGGRVDREHLAELVDLAGATDDPVIVILHHPPMPHGTYTYYPPAISRADSVALVSGLATANPRTVVLAGHTHRNRRYRIGKVEIAEVGSTKDYPGGWAGYAIHEGGIRQTVRRTGRPDVIAWTQMTAGALGGVWGRWSPGRLEDRCWSLEWS
jgi:3',5'-cyclic AMP phosphodiesterase CpdA